MIQQCITREIDANMDKAGGGSLIEQAEALQEHAESIRVLRRRRHRVSPCHHQMLPPLPPSPQQGQPRRRRAQRQRQVRQQQRLQGWQGTP